MWKDRKVVLSTLWAFVVLNFFTPTSSPLLRPGRPDADSGSELRAVLFFAVIMETAMLMVLLSRVLAEGLESLGQHRRRHTAHSVLAWSLTGAR